MRRLPLLLLVTALNAQPPVSDTSSPNELSKALFSTLSSAPGKPRDWRRFQTLMHETARLQLLGHPPADVDGFRNSFTADYRDTGFHLHELEHRSQRSGHLAHRWSRFVYRTGTAATPAKGRGAASIQFVFAEKRWWISAFTFELDVTTGSRDPIIARDTIARAQHGGYRMLLRQIEVSADRARFGDDAYAGLLGPTSYAGHDDLPFGHWQWVAPYWFIWRDRQSQPQTRSHGPEQATGAPNTQGLRDSPQSWATATENLGAEWLLLEYAKPVRATRVHILQTFQPGAIVRITMFQLDGTELEVWSREHGEAVDVKARKLSIQLPLGFHVHRVKLYLDTKLEDNFNEIDAVGLEDTRGHKHWATSAHASSMYGMDAYPRPALLSTEPPSPPMQPQIDRLQQELVELRKLVESLRRKSDR